MENILDIINFRESFYGGEKRKANTKCLFLEIDGRKTYNIALYNNLLYVKFEGAERVLYESLSEENKKLIYNYFKTKIY